MKEHVTDLLNSFVDGQLADAERRMVEAHVGKCQECERELQDLKGLTALLAKTERRPLPTGFHQRLERRRLAAEAKPAEERHLLPMPARGLAYGLSFAVVCFVAYDAFEKNALDRTAGVAVMRDGDALRYVDGRARRASTLEAAKGAAFEETVGAGAFGSSSAGPAAAAPGAPARRQARAPGAPIGVADPIALEDEKAPPARANKTEEELTNERLQAHLDSERKRMGITQIVPKGAPPEPAEKLPPMSPAEAREYVQGMTDAFRRQRMGMENYSEPVAIGGGSKPQLLKPQEPAAEGAPIDNLAAANASHNAPAAAPAPAPMLAQKPRDGDETRFLPLLVLRAKDKAGAKKLDRAGELEASAGMAQAPVTSLPYAGLEADLDRGDAQLKSRSGPAAASGARRKAAAVRGGLGGGAGGAAVAMNGLAASSGKAAEAAAAEREAEESSLAKKEAEAERRAPMRAEPEAAMAAPAPPKPPPPAPPAAAPRPRAGPPAASVARSAAELEALWRRLGKSGDLPAVDFASEMIVAVSYASPIEIVSVKTRRGGIVLECRLSGGTGPGAAFRVVPRSDRPVAVELIP